MLITNDKNYWTQQRDGGKWESRREGSQRASKVFDTQADAWESLKAQAERRKGEASLKGRNGNIRERNTYGEDPHAPAG